MGVDRVYSLFLNFNFVNQRFRPPTSNDARDNAASVGLSPCFGLFGNTNRFQLAQQQQREAPHCRIKSSLQNHVFRFNVRVKGLR